MKSHENIAKCKKPFKTDFYRTGLIEILWKYVDAEGNLIFLIMRIFPGYFTFIRLGLDKKKLETGMKLLHVIRFCYQNKFVVREFNIVVRRQAVLPYKFTIYRSENVRHS